MQLFQLYHDNTPIAQVTALRQSNDSLRVFPKRRSLWFALLLYHMMTLQM